MELSVAVRCGQVVFVSCVFSEFLVFIAGTAGPSPLLTFPLLWQPEGTEMQPSCVLKVNNLILWLVGENLIREVKENCSPAFRPTVVFLLSSAFRAYSCWVEPAADLHARGCCFEAEISRQTVNVFPVSLKCFFTSSSCFIGFRCTNLHTGASWDGYQVGFLSVSFTP